LNTTGRIHLSSTGFFKFDRSLVERKT